MRDSQQRENQILRDEAEQAVGISMSADYCAEHEWGIKRLKRSLGLPEVPQSFADNCLTKPFMLRQSDSADEQLFITTDMSEYVDLNRLARYWDSEGLDFASAWDEANFFARAVSKEGDAILSEIADAFERGDIAIFLGSGGVFKNAGLVVAIASKVPQNLKDTYDAACEDRRKLKATAEATGIYDRVPKSRYYALSPSWNVEGHTTDHPVTFWLNPTDQNDNNYGWYTVEQLDEWMAGTGPVPKVRKQSA